MVLCWGGRRCRREMGVGGWGWLLLLMGLANMRK